MTGGHPEKPDHGQPETGQPLEAQLARCTPAGAPAELRAAVLENGVRGQMQELGLGRENEEGEPLELMRPGLPQKPIQARTSSGQQRHYSLADGYDPF
jgi:hypothetical protein